MKNKEKFCNGIQVDVPRQTMCKAAVKFLHKHLRYRRCDSILNQLIIPKRQVSMIIVKQPQLSPYPSSLDKIVYLYNKLPAEVKSMTMGQMKKYLNRNPIKTS